MGGCTNCKGKAGCDDRKGPMLATIQGALTQLYPTKTWGQPAFEPIYGSAHDPSMLDALATELATELNAATFVVRGDDHMACDFIYVLCIGRTPCILQTKLHGVAPADDVLAEQVVNEMYLRLVISHRNAFCAVQQVTLTMQRDATGCTITEAPRAGVYDPPLLRRMQKLVAIVPAYDLVHLDFGEIAHAPPGFEAGDWAALFGGQPSIANYFFYDEPTTMPSTVYVDA